MLLKDHVLDIGGKLGVASRLLLHLYLSGATCKKRALH